MMNFKQKIIAAVAVTVAAVVLILTGTFLYRRLQHKNETSTIPPAPEYHEPEYHGEKDGWFFDINLNIDNTSK